MILGFSDLELAISDLGNALAYLDYAYEALPKEEHGVLTRIVEHLTSIENDLCVLFERVEQDDE